jgi:pantoate--beta-alanine ligase
VEGEAVQRLSEAGFDVDYAVVRHPDLSEPAEARPGTGAARVALVAARLGRTRLIDNIEFSL